MEQFSSLENELSELSCFCIRTSADYLSEWKKLFIEQHLIDLMSFGNICGLQSLFSQSRRTFGALIALTDVSVLSADAVRRYIDKDHFLCSYASFNECPGRVRIRPCFVCYRFFF